MQKPKKFVIRMSLFLVAVIAIAAVLSDQMMDAFMANVALNGVIIATLVIGIVFAYRRVFDLTGEIDWITSFKRHDSSASTASTPKLMAPAAALLAEQAEGNMRLSALSMRSVLDGIASRLEESREISRYFTGLLIFLGLLGTFWGLLGTIGAIGGTIKTLSVDGSDMALMFDELKAGLEAPLSGMGTAFSSSLFGLAGSLVLGFLDLQASQAQTRFYNHVEDWLASVTKLSRGEIADGSPASPDAYMHALMEQTSESITKLHRSMNREADEKHQMQVGLTALAESLSAISDRLDAQTQSVQLVQKETQETSSKLLRAIEAMAAKEPVEAEPALDEASRQHIRNLDLGMKRLLEEQTRNSEFVVDGLRSELKLLSRTLAAGMSARAEADRAAKLGGVTRDEDGKPWTDAE
ncbi:flagellar motor protein MotA [Kordiimonas sediminis]|uniref:Flagellar motor protein MotA n=1 Tax=Kordiimonas sediminis TaxID=1735581 RepID=A0A919AQS4_9PROT|nr:flagellar motor protein MotA [Kordiimonas sediminis]GHF20161.1 flagellar motor protein MotA [Kordiimonas sediminis]